MLAARDLYLLLALGMMIAIAKRKVRLLILLIILGSALYLIRESGERELRYESRESFIISARSDSSRLPQRVFGDYKRATSCSFRAESKRLSSSYRQIPLRVITDQCDIFFGEELVGMGRLVQSDEKRVAALLVVDEISERRSSWVWRELHRLRQNFRGAFTEGSDAASLVPGMVIGDESLQSDEFKSMMRLAGLSHLTAVSGANFSIVATMILWLISRWTLRRGHRIAITSFALLIFTLLVRPSPSVLRAGVMAGVVLFAQLRGDRRSGLLALAGAVIILLLIDPHQGLDAGFALSVLATAGILLLGPMLSDLLRKRFAIPELFAQVVSIPLSATLFCTPVIVGISGKLSLASIPLNIAIAPLVPLITIVGFIALLLSPISTITLPIAHLATLVATPIPIMARWSYHMPIWEFSDGWPGGLIALIGILATSWVVRLLLPLHRSGRFKGIPTILILLLLASPIFLMQARGTTWQLFQCDVGQGDALLIKTGDRSAILIDAGPDPQLVDRCLRQARVKEISLLVITHLHADHYAGIPGVLRGRKVRSWWISEPSSRSYELSEISELLPIEPRVVHQGESFQIADIRIELLSPERGVAIDDARSINNASLVLLIEKEGATILVTGDIEQEAQERIAQRYDLRGVDIYKASHHGSKSRSPAFDAQLDPDLVLISVGAENPYGHPAAQTLEVLAPATIHRTDLDGAARVTWWPLRIH